MKNTLEDRIERLSIEERSLLAQKVKQLLSEKALQSKSEASKRLVAYVTASDNFDVNQLKRSLSTKVPDYMIPSRIVKVDKFPVLPNGKIDKKALSHVAFSQVEERILKLHPPTNAVEKELVIIWQEVLGLSAIGINDNFFEIGGDSILSIRVIAKARSLGMSLSANQLFEHQTIAVLAAVINSQKVDAEAEVSIEKFEHLVTISEKGSKPPLFCLHSGGSHFFFYNLLAKYLGVDRPVYALQASGHEGEIKLHNSIEEMASDFISEIKRVYPHGPYHFVSYCFNTAIGVEITKVLIESSEPVNLIIADTFADYLSLFELSKTKARALAFTDSLKKHPVRTIRRVIGQRILLPLKKKYEAITFDKSKKKIKKLHDNHVKIYNEYAWAPQKISIQLLLTKKKNSNFNSKVIRSWENVALNGVEVVNVKGHHNNLFHEKSVETTAVDMEKCMQNFENSL